MNSGRLIALLLSAAFLSIASCDGNGAGDGGGSGGSTSYLPPLKTYQTRCWDASGNEISCAGTAQDGEYQAGRNIDFTGPENVGGDYVTRDNATGLVWKTCTEGVSGLGCSSGSASAMYWTTATGSGTGCDALNGSGFAGRTDWRVPTIEELESIMNYNRVSPSAFTASFPATVSDGYWTSSDYAANVFFSAYYASFSAGTVPSGGGDKDERNEYLRCVSGSSSLSERSFRDNGDGTVTDNGTGLVWQKCSAGQSGADCSTGTASQHTWENAVSYCNGLSVAGKSWRLPNVNEVKSIVDRTTSSPSIDASAFPSTPALGLAAVWTSSTYVNIPSNAWRVLFYDGSVDFDTKSSSHYVRCVSN